MLAFTGFAGSRPAASHFLLLRQKKVTKEKATRSLGPCASLRAPSGAQKKRGHVQTRYAQTSTRPDPFFLALLSPARTCWEKRQMQSRLQALRACRLPEPESISPNPVLAGLEKAEGDGLKNLDVRLQRSWLVSRFSGSFSFFKEPQSGPDCGSPFFSLGFFGEAKKSKSPAGASPGSYARQTAINSGAACARIYWPRALKHR